MVLTAEQVAAALEGLPEWTGDTDAITSTMQFDSFPEALVGVTAVGSLAERLDHHPDMDIRWRTVTFALSTHSAGGVTEKDIALAFAIDGVLGRTSPA